MSTCGAVHALRVRGHALALGLALAAVWRSPSLHAQSVYDSVRTATGFCHVWQMPNGGSNFPEDASYRRCALDRVPTPREIVPIPPPRFGRRAGGSFGVVVNPDGTVHPDLTRSSTTGDDSVFHRRALETIRQWRFEPGVRNGKPVRSALTLALASDDRNDTIPSRLAWRYARGEEADTLAGTWVPEAELPPFSDTQADSIYAVLLRRLVRMQVVLPGLRGPYCLLPPADDSTAHARVARIAAGVSHVWQDPRFLAPYGCDRTPGTVRLALPRIHRTENGRAVLYARGDHLPSWPPGFDGQPWRAWESRCVADVASPEGGVDRMTCDVRPDFSRDELPAWIARRDRPAAPTPRAYADGDSVRVTVFVTTGGAYRTDTLRHVVRQVPRLDERAIRDPDLPCGGWSAHSLDDADELYVVQGDPSGHSLDITRVTKGAPRTPPSNIMRCGPQEPRIADFAAFLLGGIGDGPTAPITLCFSRCARSYVLDPARHTLAEGPQIRFRRSDLREDTRMGEQLYFRIVAEPAPARLLPVVIVRFANKWPTKAWIARNVGANTWDYTVSYADGYPLDAEFHVYLIAR